MSKLSLDLNTLDVTSYDPTPAGSEDEAQVTPTVLTLPIGFTLAWLTDNI